MFPTEPAGRGDRPCAASADNAARARVYHNIVVVAVAAVHEKLVLRGGHRVRSGICAAADAKGFRVAARGQKKKTRTGTGTPTRFGRPVGARAICGPPGGEGRPVDDDFVFYLFTIRVRSNPLHNLLLVSYTTRFRVPFGRPRPLLVVFTVAVHDRTDNRVFV